MRGGASQGLSIDLFYNEVFTCISSPATEKFLGNGELLLCPLFAAGKLSLRQLTLWAEGSWLMRIADI